MLILIAIFSLLGIVFSSFALFEHIAHEIGSSAGTGFCNLGGNFNCGAVLTSNWSVVFGIPLASYGILFYLALLFFSVISLNQRLVPRKIAGNVLFTLALLAFLDSVFLYYISYMEIKAFCPFCLGTYLVNVLLLIASWIVSRDYGFLSSVIGGIYYLVTYPLVVLGLVKTSAPIKAMLARLSFALAIIVVPLIYVLPKFIAGKIAPPTSNPDQIVQSWNSAPVTNFNLNLEGGVDVDYARGPEDAPVTILEFSDFECPACRIAYTWIEDLIEQNPGKIRLIYRNFPLDQKCNRIVARPFHQNACFAAQFARCAGEQDKFWETADLLFTLNLFEGKDLKQSVEERILELTTPLSLDKDGIQECLSDKRQHSKILSDVEDGLGLDIQGTPTIWINGKRIAKVNSDTLTKIVALILSQNSAN